MPTHDPTQARMNAREELHNMIHDWAERHPELIDHIDFLADHACDYIFDELIGEGDERAIGN